ncbi:mechanosensitive ion channel family protein [Salisediminibacterium halotolerans]|uniref:Small conductance mechanosensitive channel n=1 Tax=Salisediminibacterium halotolerans TaxID=517425 RepID=A0A1H9WLY6_9BACI|nr:MULTISPECIES: mechanosensitive ion channel family protein [Salisediminibacterium]RLJ74368.1 small conductance mechanosensitive channel [Actinophytocola xinjiangensis]RPE87539.1 small conductance mechanosensitive channel [Salisediminibacterium halotolerans]TWG35205.1 small conductance mechanosensitive channel [Salisediminibacterium halotolerans]SES34908.1 small conductance mechanosensitive channel [Salisediminibacterium haloalkalitolerans]GEL08163.1 putative MscS family protein YkuT [Salised
MDWIQTIDWQALGTKALTVGLQLAGILIAFFIIRALGKKMISNSFSKMSEKQNIGEGRAATLERLALNVFSYILLFILATLIVGIFEYDVTALIAGAGIVGLAVGFGAQGLVSDIVTGFFILLEKQLEVEEYVTVAGLDGVVEEVGLRTTRIRGFDGTVHYIPNREIGSLSNHSRSNMRALVDISIAYNENIDQAMDIMQRACDRVAENDERIKEGPHVVGVQTLGDSDVVIRILSQTANMEQWAVERDLRKAMKESLDEYGIEIPFPHQVNLYKNEKEAE